MNSRHVKPLPPTRCRQCRKVMSWSGELCGTCQAERDRRLGLNLHWLTPRPRQGQVVEYSVPQVSGASEGEEGAGEGLSLRHDHSSRGWSVEDSELGEILRGVGNPVPSPAEAIKARADRRLSKKS